MTLRAFAPLAMSLFLSACLGGGGGDSGEPTAAVANSSGSAAAPGSASTANTGAGGLASITSPSANTSAGSGTAIYDRPPAIASCDAGQLKMSEKQAVLTELNAVRQLHRLPPVTYDSSADIYVQKSALIGVANKQLTHAPATSLYCYTTEGAKGSSQSNLFLAGGYVPASTEGIARFLIDDNVSTLGHRRWILHPFLSQTSFGRVDGPAFAGGTTQYSSMSLRVIGGPAADLSGLELDHVAYPEGSYPARYFKHGWLMSFSVLESKASADANGAGAVNLGGAQVAVTGPGGTTLSISERSANNDFYGLPNHLQWKAAGTQNNVDYAVRITGAMVNGQSRTFQYTFRIVP